MKNIIPSNRDLLSLALLFGYIAGLIQLSVGMPFFSALSIAILQYVLPHLVATSFSISLLSIAFSTISFTCVIFIALYLMRHRLQVERPQAIHSISKKIFWLDALLFSGFSVSLVLWMLNFSALITAVPFIFTFGLVVCVAAQSIRREGMHLKQEQAATKIQSFTRGRSERKRYAMRVQAHQQKEDHLEQVFLSQPKIIHDAWLNPSLMANTRYDWDKEPDYLVKLVFEHREPGYAQSMKAAYAFALNPDQSQASLMKVILGIHACCFTEVSNLTGGVQNIPGAFGDTGTKYDAKMYPNGPMTQEARQEVTAFFQDISQQPRTADSSDRMFIFEAECEGLFRYHHCHNKTETPQVVQQLIDAYQSKMKVSSNHKAHKADQLRYICELCMRLAQLHPFGDCNGRIFQQVLLQKLLKEHGFPPALCDDPNRAIYYSLDQYVEYIQYSMKKSLIFQELFNDSPKKAQVFFRLTAELARTKLNISHPLKSDTSRLYDASPVLDQFKLFCQNNESEFEAISVEKLDEFMRYCDLSETKSGQDYDAEMQMILQEQKDMQQYPKDEVRSFEVSNRLLAIMTGNPRTINRFEQCYSTTEDVSAVEYFSQFFSQQYHNGPFKAYALPWNCGAPRLKVTQQLLAQRLIQHLNLDSSSIEGIFDSLKETGMSVEERCALFKVLPAEYQTTALFKGALMDPSDDELDLVFMDYNQFFKDYKATPAMLESLFQEFYVGGIGSEKCIKELELLIKAPRLFVDSEKQMLTDTEDKTLLDYFKEYKARFEALNTKESTTHTLQEESESDEADAPAAAQEEEAEGLAAKTALGDTQTGLQGGSAVQPKSAERVGPALTSSVQAPPAGELEQRAHVEGGGPKQAQ